MKVLKIQFIYLMLYARARASMSDENQQPTVLRTRLLTFEARSDKKES